MKDKQSTREPLKAGGRRGRGCCLPVDDDNIHPPPAHAIDQLQLAQRARDLPVRKQWT